MDAVATLVLAGAAVAVSVALTGCQGLDTAREIVAATNRVVTNSSPHSEGFVPYLDVTKAETRKLRTQMSRSGVTRFVVGPVTGASGMCAGMWGLSPAEDLLARRNVKEIRAAGGVVIPSIGGPRTAAIDSLAANCTSVHSLADALDQLADFGAGPGGPARLDLSLTDDELGDESAVEMLIDGLARLQERRGDDEPLVLTVTLPADSQKGLSDPGRRLLARLLKGQVRIATVVADVVVPSGHQPATTNAGMGAYAVRTARQVHEDLVDVYREHGAPLDDASAWLLLGLRVSIGEHQSSGSSHPVMTVENAHEVADFADALTARGTPLGLLSMWSFNRDRRCPYQGTTLDVVSGAPWSYPQSRCNLAGSEFAFSRALLRE